MKRFATPVNVRQLRSLMGLASYYCWFVPAFSKMASPLLVKMLFSSGINSVRNHLIV